MRSLSPSRFRQALRLIATVPGNELDAVARMVRLGGRIIRGMYGWTVRQLSAVKSLVKHGHFRPMAAPYHPGIVRPMAFDLDEQTLYDMRREWDDTLTTMAARQPVSSATWWNRFEAMVAAMEQRQRQRS